MRSVFERLLLPENLNYAWIKAKNIYRSADGYIDAGEVAAFEIDLEQRLLDIRSQFERGTYRLKKLRPLPRPKKITEGNAVNRQYYHIAIEDQVAWIALINAMGPDLDLMMEPWSYGNRLYRPAWYEKNEASVSKLEIGPYRHASGHLYRKFQHSWPLFRRHVTLTARMMALCRPLREDEMDVSDQLAAVAAEHTNLPYFSNGFWQPTGRNQSNLFHASIDLKQFFPRLNIEAVAKGLAAAGAMAEPKIANLVGSMLNFQLNMAEMPETALVNVDPPFLKKSIKGIPTGLFVAGFLANVAMLPIDQIVAGKINERHDIAHFRFVDDHTFIAYDFDALCEWIIWYERLLRDKKIGPEVNADKFDPASLGEWIKHIRTVSPADLSKKDLALREAQFDGKNPTKLMTKTLAQVSAIATADIHILDDEDLSERLKLLEWLLLADIPEREIRPDTRAAFAAGQITSLVPVLVQEADGLVDVAREVAAQNARGPSPDDSTKEDFCRYDEKMADLDKKLRFCMNEQDKDERALLNRCFTLLLQSLREHPDKVRIFQRIHQYCRVTGHRGLEAIWEWLKETRANGLDSWADYYTALSLQIMARGMLTAVSRLMAPDVLRSDIKASESYLSDIAALNGSKFCVPSEREAWFHAVGRREFGVALKQVAALLPSKYDKIARRLSALSQSYISVSPANPSAEWSDEAGWPLGVWAHLAEEIVGSEAGPSAAWMALAPHFNFSQPLDLKAARRYPEALSDAGWKQFLAAPLPQSDSAWLREIIGDDPKRREEALASGMAAFTRAARSIEPVSKEWVTIGEWTKCVHECSPFDPRCGEWTALEITAQLLESATVAGGDEAVLDRLYPNNVLLPRKWISSFPCCRERTELHWEKWRRLVQNNDNAGNRYHARLRPHQFSLIDYRYVAGSKVGIPLPAAERRLRSAGRLLLGLLRNDHSAPRIWNLRGNELVVRLPRARWYETLAISSPTTLILEACLGTRPAETRTITREPGLFGWDDGKQPNDTAFDPPLFYGSTGLLESIRNAQRILESNQLAVAQNQPRQLIPFRLADFAAGVESIGETVGEGVNDGE